jgi:hypothetical protein
MSSFGHDLETVVIPGSGATRSVNPVQFDSISRIGSSIYAMATGTGPGGPEATLESAWGFMAGKAPPGTSSLTVAANGTAFIRGSCYAYSGGVAEATGSIYVFVEEFLPVGAPVHEHDSSFSSTTHDDETIAELDPGPTASIGSLVWTGLRPTGGWTALLDLRTSVLGYQVSTVDSYPLAPMMVMPVSPGNSYRWWIACYQYAGLVPPGGAVSNIAFDFGPVFYAFT